MSKPLAISMARFCRERPPWQSVSRERPSIPLHASATEGVPYRCRRRGGYLLTETLVVIGVSSALAAVAIGLLGSLLRLERVGRRHMDEANGLARLSKQFRRDVAAAEEASVPEESKGPLSELRLRLSADRTVTYRAEPGGLLRLEEEGQAAAARERFHLPATAEARFAVENGEANRMVVLMLEGATRVERKAEGGDPAIARRRRLVLRDGVGRRGWNIHALVGRDLRYAHSGGETKPADD